MVATDCAKKLSQSGQRCATLLSDIASLVESILPEYECIITNDCWSQLVSHFLCQTVAGSLPLKMEDYHRVLAQRLAVTVWMPRTRIATPALTQVATMAPTVGFDFKLE